jgi:hypothetical protein
LPPARIELLTGLRASLPLLAVLSAIRAPELLRQKGVLAVAPHFFDCLF